MKRKGLVLCTGNSCCSQMAEAIVNARLGNRWQPTPPGRSSPAMSIRSIRAWNTPITNISPREAKAFARRLGARLPTYDEIRELLKVPRGSPSRFHHPSAPTEWLNCAPEWEPAGTGMNCIASINGDTMALSHRGSLQDRRYPFVTFRIVKE